MSRILLVEDNDLNRDMLARRLVRRGFDVILAKDGAEAMALAASEQPDLILMDMSLPVLDGWEVARRLKADAKTAKLPIIAITAHVMSGDRERALDAGCDDYDVKPVEFERLLQKIEAQIEKG